MVQISGKGAALGFGADLLLKTFPLGTIVGGFARNVGSLLGLDAKDMGQVDTKTVEREGADWGKMDLSNLKAKVNERDWGGVLGELSGMAAGLFGRPAEDAKLKPDADNPENEAPARQIAKKEGGGFPWGKALLIGGGVYCGLMVLKNIAPLLMFGLGGYGMFMNPLMMW